jgi:hypothetical protein
MWLLFQAAAPLQPLSSGIRTPRVHGYSFVLHLHVHLEQMAVTATPGCSSTPASGEWYTHTSPTRLQLRAASPRAYQACAAPCTTRTPCARCMPAQLLLSTRLLLQVCHVHVAATPCCSTTYAHRVVCCVSYRSFTCATCSTPYAQRVVCCVSSPQPRACTVAAA